MEQGLYEQIINNITSQQLDELDPELYEVGKEKLDAEEARKLLSTYLAAVTRRALKVVREQNYNTLIVSKGLSSIR
ncbi:hypothetical protein D3C73_903260 [compost metagenome]